MVLTRVLLVFLGPLLTSEVRLMVAPLSQFVANGDNFPVLSNSAGVISLLPGPAQSDACSGSALTASFSSSFSLNPALAEAVHRSVVQNDIRKATPSKQREYFQTRNRRTCARRNCIKLWSR